MNTPYLPKGLATAVLSLCLIAVPPASWAADNFTATTGADKPAKGKKTKQAKAPKAAKAPKMPTDKGSGENKAERDKRLLRECRGKPNAGACEGYAN